MNVESEQINQGKVLSVRSSVVDVSFLQRLRFVMF